MKSQSEIIKSLIYDVVVKAAIQRLIAAIPLMSVPVIGPVLGFILTQCLTLFADKLYEHLAMFGYFVMTDFETEEQRQKYETAVAELKKALDTKNQEEIDRASKEFDARLRDLIRFPDRVRAGKN